MDYDPTITEHKGAYGTAVQLSLPDIPSAAETVDAWLLTAPMYHPLWSQYMLGVVRLRKGIPGFPDPRYQFEGATHELNVVALNPEDGPYDPATYFDRPYAFLTPVNIAEQFEATDDELRKLAWYAALGVVHGVANPETADAPTRIRESWKTMLVKTLAHLRGESHAC